MPTNDNSRLPIIKKSKDGELKMNLKGVQNIIEIHEKEKQSKKTEKKHVDKKVYKPGTFLDA